MGYKRVRVDGLQFWLHIVLPVAGLVRLAAVLAVQVREFEGALIEAAELDGRIIDGPESVVDFLEADVLVDEDGGDTEIAVAPADAAVSRDFADLEVAGVVDWRQAVGKRAVARVVERARDLLRERFVCRSWL